MSVVRLIFFFFSSRRRHTRCSRDWSSDVCSSDLEAAIVGSVAHTNRAVVIEEGWPHAGIGAQVVDIIQREAFDQLDAPVLRVTQADVPMPYNKQLERLAKPSADRVVAAARRVLYLD